MSVAIHWLRALCEIEHVIEIYQFLRANLSPIFIPVFHHSFSTASRRIRDAMRPSMRLSFPSFIQFSLHAHTCTHVSFFFAKFIYLEAKADEKSSNFSNTSLHERYVKFSKFSKFSLSFSLPQIYRESKCIEIYIYIYMYVFTVDQAILRERLGRGEGLFATTCKLRGFERLGWKASRVHCSASTLLFFNVRFLFHSLLSPIQTKFPATLLYLPFHLVYLIIHVACMYVYIYI